MEKSFNGNFLEQVGPEFERSAKGKMLMNRGTGGRSELMELKFAYAHTPT